MRSNTNQDSAVAVSIRVALLTDIPGLQVLISESARVLSKGYYSGAETEAAIQYMFGIDTTLITDRTYFVAERNGELVGCGGWSKRAKLCGGDQRLDPGNVDANEPAPGCGSLLVGNNDLLIPGRDAARIRAFFVSPSASRCGVGRAIFLECTADAKKSGFDALELMATLPGVPFYSSLGFAEIEQVTDVTPDGTPLAFVRMRRSI